MPTPSDSTTQLTLGSDPHLERSTHATCPPDYERIATQRSEDHGGPDPDDIVGGEGAARQQDSSTSHSSTSHSQTPVLTENNNQETPHPPTDSMDQDTLSADALSPMSGTAETKDGEQPHSPGPMPATDELSSSPSTYYGISNIRVGGA